MWGNYLHLYCPVSCSRETQDRFCEMNSLVPRCLAKNVMGCTSMHREVQSYTEFDLLWKLKLFCLRFWFKSCCCPFFLHNSVFYFLLLFPIINWIKGFAGCLWANRTWQYPKHSILRVTQKKVHNHWKRTEVLPIVRSSP
jgi:hypothetical protein